VQTTLGQIVDAEPALGRLLKERLPIAQLYWITELGGVLLEKIRAFRAQEFTLIVRDGLEQPSGNWVIAPGMPQFAAFKADVDTLRAIAVDLAWTPMDSAAMGAACASGEDMLALRPFLTMAPPKGDRP